MRKKERQMRADLDSRIGKYFLNRQKGMRKGEAQLKAGFPDTMHASRIEKTKTYKEIEKVYYKDALLAKIDIAGIAEEHLKNILQDKDRGAKNMAIKMALDKIEPEAKQERDDDKVMIILREPRVHEAEVTEAIEVDPDDQVEAEIR